jgi:hypothetical protein
VRPVPVERAATPAATPAPSTPEPARPGLLGRLLRRGPAPTPPPPRGATPAPPAAQPPAPAPAPKASRPPTQLQLRRSAPRLTASPTPATPAGPAPGGSTAATLAAATGAAYAADGSGVATIDFGAPAPAIQTLGLDDLRSAVPAASSLAHAVAPSLPIEQGLHAVSGVASQATHLAQSVGHAAAGAAGAAAHAAGAGGADELYEQVVERLRRDLLVERERMGDLLGDL